MRTPLFLLAAWATIGCTCSSEKEMAEIDDPIEAEIVWRTARGIKWEGGGHYVVVPTGFEKRESAVLKAEGFNDRLLGEWSWTKETAVELASDTTGARLAYREQGNRWRLVFLAAKDHVFLGDSRYADLDWNKLPDFSAAAAELFTALAVNRQQCVLDEVEKRGGPAALAKILIDTAEVPSDDAWDKAMKKLPPDERARVASDLRRRLLRKSSGLARSRALRYVRLRDPALADILLAATKDELARAVRGARTAPVDESDLMILLRASAQLRPKATAELACQRIEHSGTGDAFGAAFVALAQARAGCPAADKALAERLCEPELTCAADARCSQKELEQVAKLEINGDPAAASEAANTFTGDTNRRVALWATRLAPPPAAFAKLAARMRYRTDGPAAPSCNRSERASDPCGCNAKELSASLCRSVDAVEGETRSCRYRIDDAGQRIFDVRSKRAGRWQTVEATYSWTLGLPPLLCGIASDRSVHCRRWPEEDDSEPVAIAGVSDAKSLALASAEQCALTGDGSVWCWGSEGTGSEKQLSAATRIALPKAIEIAATEARVCALSADGQVRCWSDASRAAPEVVPGLEGSQKLVNGADQLTAVSRDGRGLLYGCERTTCRAHVAPWSSVERVFPGDDWTFARLPDGRIQGVPSVSITSAGADGATPRFETLEGLGDVTLLRAAQGSGCALAKDGVVRCWTTSKLAVDPVLRDATSLALTASGSGGANVAATRSDGSLSFWTITTENVESAKTAE